MAVLSSTHKSTLKSTGCTDAQVGALDATIAKLQTAGVTVSVDALVKLFSDAQAGGCPAACCGTISADFVAVFA